MNFKQFYFPSRSRTGCGGGRGGEVSEWSRRGPHFCILVNLFSSIVVTKRTNYSSNLAIQNRTNEKKQQIFIRVKHRAIELDLICNTKRTCAWFSVILLMERTREREREFFFIFKIFKNKIKKKRKKNKLQLSNLLPYERINILLSLSLSLSQKINIYNFI